jgi:hypothetical protein
MRLAMMTAVVVGLLGGHARAASLELISSGTLAAGATVGKTTLAAATAFTVEAVFNPTGGIAVGHGFEFAATSVTFDVTGVGTFVAAPGADIYAVFADTVSPTPYPYEAGLVNSSGLYGFIGDYKTSSQAFSAATPTATMFGDYQASASGSYLVSLANGAGQFSLGDITSAPITTAIVGSPVPEPTAMVLMGIGAAGLGMALLRRRRR